MAQTALCLHFYFDYPPETLNKLECRWKLYDKLQWVYHKNLLRPIHDYHLVVWAYAPKGRSEERRVKGIANKLGISKTHYIPLSYNGDIYEGRASYQLIKQHDGGLFGEKVNP